jgi:hypothetical protein
MLRKKKIYRTLKTAKVRKVGKIWVEKIYKLSVNFFLALDLTAKWGGGGGWLSGQKLSPGLLRGKFTSTMKKFSNYLSLLMIAEQFPGKKNLTIWS